jgi:hypothetical protein
MKNTLQIAGGLKIDPENPRIVQQWKDSTDITERALANGILEVVGSEKNAENPLPPSSREQRANTYFYKHMYSSEHISVSGQFPEVIA